jgi:hypothetical protein
VFFAPTRYRVVKIACSCSDMVLQTTNYKAHYDLSYFRSILWGNSPTSNFVVLKKMNSVTMGWAESSKYSLRERGKCSFVHPCLKGRGLCVAVKRLDNYYLLQLFLYPRSDLHDHEVQIQGRRFIEVGWILPPCSGPLLDFSGLPLTIPQALHGSGCPSRFEVA